MSRFTAPRTLSTSSNESQTGWNPPSENNVSKDSLFLITVINLLFTRLFLKRFILSSGFELDCGGSSIRQVDFLAHKDSLTIETESSVMKTRSESARIPFVVLFGFSLNIWRKGILDENSSLRFFNSLSNSTGVRRDVVTRHFLSLDRAVSRRALTISQTF